MSKKKLEWESRNSESFHMKVSHHNFVMLGCQTRGDVSATDLLSAGFGVQPKDCQQ